MSEITGQLTYLGEQSCPRNEEIDTNKRLKIKKRKKKNLKGSNNVKNPSEAAK